MSQEEHQIIKPEVNIKFQKYLQELYSVLIEEDIPNDTRISEAQNILSIIDNNIPENEFVWSDYVPGNLMFLIIDRLLFFNIDICIILNRGNFDLNYFTKYLIPIILEKPYINLITLIPEGEFPDQGRIYTAYSLIERNQEDLARIVINQISDYRFRAICLLRLAKHLQKQNQHSKIESLIYEIIIESSQAETHLQKTMSLVEATEVMIECNPTIAKLLMKQALPEVLKINNDSWNRHDQLVKLAGNYAKIGECKKAEKMIGHMTDQYFVAQGWIALVDYYYQIGSNKIAQPIIKLILRISRKLEAYFRWQITEKTMTCLIKYKFYGDVFFFLPHFIHDLTELASAYICLAKPITNGFRQVNFLQRSLKNGSPNEETCVQIIEIYVNYNTTQNSDHWLS